MGDDAPHPKYLICNADEMEPGTFKDRLLLEGDPHQLIEGMIVSAYADPGRCRLHFPALGLQAGGASGWSRQSPKRTASGYLGRNILGSEYSLELHLHVSAGRYMCGEETALLNALEGKRANPRAKPPYPQVSGLWGKPTVVNNVETLCNVPHIVNQGAAWFKNLSRSDDGGTKLYGVSGRVKKPGLWELPMGTPIREILEEHAGGMRDGYRFRGLLPGGASTDFMIADHLDVAMDFDSMQAAGSRLGTGTMIVLDDKTCPGRHAAQSGTFLRAGIVRLVHALLVWAVVGRTDTARPGRGQGEASDLERLAISCAPAGPGAHVLRTGAGRRGTVAKRAQVFPRRFRPAHPREALPLEI